MKSIFLILTSISNNFCLASLLSNAKTVISKTRIKLQAFALPIVFLAGGRQFIKLPTSLFFVRPPPAAIFFQNWLLPLVGSGAFRKFKQRLARHADCQSDAALVDQKRDYQNQSSLV